MTDAGDLVSASFRAIRDARARGKVEGMRLAAEMIAPGGDRQAIEEAAAQLEAAINDGSSERAED